MATETTREAKQKAAEARRKARIEELRSEYDKNREASLDKIIEIESATGKFYLENDPRSDLAVVWLRSGKCVILGKPLQLQFEKYELKVANSKIDAQAMDELLAHPTVLWPDRGELERYADEDMSVKFACVTLARKLGEVDAKAMEGKF
jgi:hypothetical protein